MKIRRVVRSLTAARMEVVVEGIDGELRSIEYTWVTKEGANAPMPEIWYQAVFAEYQEARRKDGPVTDLNDLIS